MLYLPGNHSRSLFNICSLSLGEIVVGRGVANQEDGDGGQPDVGHQVLVVARLSPDLPKHQVSFI